MKSNLFRAKHHKSSHAQKMLLTPPSDMRAVWSTCRKQQMQIDALIEEVAEQKQEIERLRRFLVV